MKKTILGILAFAALLTMMLFNIQLFETKDSSTITLALVENIAIADGEGGGSGNGHCDDTSTPNWGWCVPHIGGNLCQVEPGTCNCTCDQ